MNYRFVKVTTFYRDYLSYYYSRNINEAEKSYDEQYSNLMGDCFAWADFFGKELARLGVDAHELFYSAAPLQKAWAAEHNTRLSGKELVMFQMKELKPDVVFLQDTDVFNGVWADELRKQVGSIKQIIGWCCSPYSEENLKLFAKYDYMFTCSEAFAADFEKHGIKTYVLRHAFDPSVLESMNKPTQPEHDFVFIGSLIANNDYHNLRTDIIETLLKSGIDLELYSNLRYDTSGILLGKQAAYLLTKLMMKLGLKNSVLKNPVLEKFIMLNEIPRNPKFSDRLKAAAKPPVYGLDMFNALADAKISLNIHGGVAGDYAANMRLFEATGVGSCLITDKKKNLGELFEIDKEIVAFETAEECVEKVNWLLGHSSEREEIAKAGQQRVLKDHTFKIRAGMVDEIIKKHFKQR